MAEHVCFRPFRLAVLLVAQPWLRFHTPLIEPDVQISRASGSPDKTSRRLSRATPSAASEHHLELIDPMGRRIATIALAE